jgi:hypothetical protein
VDRDVVESHLIDHVGQPVDPTLHGLDQVDVGVGAHESNDNPGEAGTAPEVDHRVLVADERDDRRGVHDVP